jgi:hypothetical protein
VDARDAISDSELAAWQVYYSDQRHFLPRGNETIAHALREKISELGEWANIPK